ncbi:MAG: FMN-binding protein [Eubacteriales bacterium]|nr:FMN-binding protein [Eubacteriales bacterium]MDD3349801.1 FMN-binding protein [Eubacteriales bacterium]
MPMNKTEEKSVAKISKSALLLLGAGALVLCLSFCLYLFGGEAELSEEEAAACNEILGTEYSASEYEDISSLVLSEERKAAYPAVKKVCLTPNGDYAILAVPQGYKGPIRLALVISGESEKTMGLRILEHMETEHYVRDMENSWFTDRFSGKGVGEPLEVVKLEALADNEIIAITGATMTTESITEGVNQCLALFKEYRFEEKQKNLKETGSITVYTPEGAAGEVSLEEIQKMPAVKRSMEIRSSEGTTSHVFRGTLLSNVIAGVDPTLLERYEWVEPIGVDGYLSDLSMQEVLAENAVYLMYEDKGQALEKKDGELGAMRIVVLDDDFGQRFTNYVVEISLK